MNMNTSIRSYGNQTFTARCPQVRDADWVCRVINHTMPHFSSTKHQPRITRYLKANNDVLKCDKELKTMSDIYDFIDDIEFTEGHDKLQDTVMAIKRMIRRVAYKRLDAEEKVGNGTFNDNLYGSLWLMTQERIGNCTENAILAELVMKMNGVQNACCAILNKGPINSKNAEPLDHLVCIVNRDKSSLQGQVTRKTIIVDPWLGKAGFAKDMERFYRNECAEFFELGKDEFVKYQLIETVDVSETVMQRLVKNLSELIFKNKNRKFFEK